MPIFQGKLGLLRTRIHRWRGTFQVQATTTRPKITVATDGTGVVSHAGSRLLADLADQATLTAELAEGLVMLRKPRARHDPGRILIDLAVAVADRGHHDL